MATKRYYFCQECGSAEVSDGLFDLLLAMTQNDRQSCPQCFGPCELRLKFAFGLNAQNAECTFLHSFLPAKLESWKDRKGHPVIFYPFLVMVKRHGRATAAWLPYWHVVQDGPKKIKKYGQWAPFMNFHLFADLIAQARSKGYLKKLSKNSKNSVVSA